MNEDNNIDTSTTDRAMMESKCGMVMTIFSLPQLARGIWWAFYPRLLAASTVWVVLLLVFAGVFYKAFGDLYSKGITYHATFSTFGESCLALFKVATLDGWSDLMYQVEDAESGASAGLANQHLALSIDEGGPPFARSLIMGFKVRPHPDGGKTAFWTLLSTWISRPPFCILLPLLKVALPKQIGLLAQGIADLVEE